MKPISKKHPDKNPIITPVITPYLFVLEKNKPSKNKPTIGPIKAPFILALICVKFPPIDDIKNDKHVQTSPHINTIILFALKLFLSSNDAKY